MVCAGSDQIGKLLVGSSEHKSFGAKRKRISAHNDFLLKVRGHAKADEIA